MNCVAIIPARGGSQRIPRKNIRDFHGKPIIAYSIEAAQRSQLFDRIVVSTDDDEIAHVARRYRADVLLRPAELADSITGTQAVVAHVLANQLRIDAGLACCIYPTAPLMTADDLALGRRHVRNGARFAMSVSDTPLADAGQWYWGRVTSFTWELPLVAPRTAMVPIPASRVCDINTFEDWARAEQMYLNLKGQQ